MSLVGLCWFIPDDDLDTTFPTFHLQVACWKKSLELNPLAEAHSPPPSTQQCRATSQVPWMLRKASRGVSAWRILDSRQVACNNHWRMIYWWGGLGGAASSRQDGWGSMPGSWNSSELFSSRSDKAGSKKTSWKGSMVLPSRWGVWASSLGNSESPSSPRVSQLSMVRGTCQYLVWPSGHRGVQGGAMQCSAEVWPGHWQQSENFSSVHLAIGLILETMGLPPLHLCFAGDSGC